MSYKVSGLQCFSNAVRFTARQQENGFSGVTQFRQLAQQHVHTSGGWANLGGTAQVTSTRFPDNGRSYSFTRVWTARHAVTGASYRVLWQGLYYSGSPLAYRTPVITATCL